MSTHQGMLIIENRKKMEYIIMHLFIHIYSLIQVQAILVPAFVKPCSKQDDLDL